MKIKLLLVFLAFSLLSCSSDDSNDPVNTNPDDNPPVEKHVKEIAHYQPLSEGNGMELYLLYKYENGLLKEEYYYNSDGEIGMLMLHTHDNEGKLIFMEGGFSQNVNEVNITFEYDSMDRLTSSHFEYPGQLLENYFIYNYDVSDQIITNRTNTNYQGEVSVSNWISYLDNEGRIYKYKEFVENSRIREAVYENDNIVSITTSEYDESINAYTITSTSNYLYDMETEVKGEYIFATTYNNTVLDVNTNQFGSNKANEALFNNKRVSFIKSNYPNQFWINGELYHTWEYQFDEDGYPILARRKGPNGEIYHEEHITYYE